MHTQNQRWSVTVKLTDRVPKRVDYGQQQDGPQVVEEGTEGHVVASIIDDGGQEEEEEGVGVQHILGGAGSVGEVED